MKNDNIINYIEALFSSRSISFLTRDNLRKIEESLKESSYPCNIKTKSILLLRKFVQEDNLNDYALLLSKSINVDMETARQILNQPIKNASFPVVLENRVFIRRVYTIKLGKKTVFSFANSGEFSTISTAIDSGFFAMFDGYDFKGSSFMLAVCAALIASNQSVLDKFIFSGVIDIKGNILEVEQLDTKKAYTNEKVFISYKEIRNLFELDKLLNSDRMDFPFFVALKKSKKSDSVRGSSFDGLTDIKKQNSFAQIKALGMKDEDFVYHAKDMLPDSDWSDMLLTAYKRIIKIKSKINKLGKIPVLHLAILGPATFAFGLGALLGAKDPFIFYQYFSGEYKSVLDFSEKNIRLLKQVEDKFERVVCRTEIKNKKELAMVYYLASHNPSGDVRSFLKEPDFFVCTAKNNQGFLDSGDWSDYVKEMYSAYNKTKDGSYIKRHFFFSCPLALAFGLGAAIELFENGDVYNLVMQGNSYVRVFNLKSLNKI